MSCKSKLLIILGHCVKLHNIIFNVALIYCIITSLGYAVKSNQITSGSRILSETDLICVMQK